MLDIVLWCLLGLLSSWVGYLATRTTKDENNTSYIITGVATALIVGFTTRAINFLPVEKYSQLNPNSLLIVFLVSGMSVMIIGVVKNSSRSH